MTEQRKGALSALAVTLTILNTLRYNLPARVWLRDVFDLLNIYAWGIAATMLWLYEDRPIIKSIYFFGLLGIGNSILNETFFNATLPQWKEVGYMIGAIIASILYYLYLWKKKLKDDLRN